MNIKNPRVHALAREAARLTGQSQTAVVEEALERLLAQLAKDDESHEHALDQLMAEIEAEVTDDDRAAVTRFMQEMHDDAGLPA